MGLEDNNDSGNCRVAIEENLDYECLPDKCVTFSRFLGLPVMRCEKEINSLLKKPETKRGHGVKITRRKKKSPLATHLEKDMRKLECSVHYNCFPLSYRGRRRGSGVHAPFF